jgi:ketosteroid isomerase-like protein
VKPIRVLCLIAAMAVSAMAIGQEPAKQAPKMGSKEWTDLENVLWDADQQWLCSAGATPYHQDYKECIEFRNKYWCDQFFEISMEGQVQTKSEMIARQRAAHPSKGVGPHPDDFKLMALYGDVALATDHTFLQRESTDGKVAGTNVRVLRIFVKENGTWRPASGALVPITK